MSGAGIIKTNYRDTYYFQPNTMLQFGGSGDDRIYDTKLLTTGDYAIAGYSTSSSLDGNANPNAASWFIAVIDKAFPTSGFIKAIAWENAASSYVIGGHYGRALLTVDSSDNIYYMYGSAATSTNFVVKKRSGTDLSVTATSAAFNAWYGVGKIIVYGTQLHVYQTKSTGNRVYVLRLNASNLSSAGSEYDTGIITNGSPFMSIPVEYGSYVAIGSAQYPNNYYPGVGLFNPLTFKTFANGSAMVFGVGYWEGAKPNADTDGTHLYYLGRHSTATSLQLKKVLKSDVSYTDVANLEITNCNPDGFMAPFYYGGSLYLVGSNTVAGKIGTSDPYLYKINPATMLATDSDYIKYSSGTQIGVAGTSWSLAHAPIAYDTNKFLLSGYTTGNLSGFVNQGSNDCVMMKTNLSGEIL